MVRFGRHPRLTSSERAIGLGAMPLIGSDAPFTCASW
jgi:hypothetical protein